jgi:hypothetical protein
MITDLPERIVGKIQRGDPDECWDWAGALNSMGYPIASAHEGQRVVTRIVMQNEGHRLARQRNVCHICDRPACCNPRHLFVGTQKDNMQDCVRKGRSIKGAKNGKVVLTEQQVLAIRADKRPERTIAPEYGISRATVGDIRRRRSWPHLP